MRPEGNPLDLNNLPEEYGRDGKQVLEESSTTCTEASDTTRFRKKKSGAKDGKDECGKVYECRFCSLKFCKSQALGGHMNRHRQERETETLNRARQLVFCNENIAAQGGTHLGLRDPNLGDARPISSGNFHQSGNMGDPSLPFRPVYSTRLFSGSSSAILSPPPPPPQPYLYSSSSRLVSYPSHYAQLHTNLNCMGAAESSYTCIGAPLGHGFPPNDRVARGTDLSTSSGGGDGSLRNRDGLNWGGSYVGTQQCLDPSSIGRFQDRF